MQVAKEVDRVDERYKASDQIRELRSAERLQEAIEICAAARTQWPKDIYFSKILSDLHFQAGNYSDAFIALADLLEIGRPNGKLIAEFGRRYNRFRRVLSSSEISGYAQLLSKALESVPIDPSLKRSVRKIISADMRSVLTSNDSAHEKLLLDLLQDDAGFDEFVRQERSLEEVRKDLVISILDEQVLNRERIQNAFRIDLYCVSIYEKLGHHGSALKVVSELLELRLDTVAVRSLFRICRLIKDYSFADALLERQPSLLRSQEFNMLYEFVYYFEAKNDYHQVQSILRTLDKSFAQNLPVLRTLKNFYIRFGLIDEARALEKKIENLVKGGRGVKVGGRFAAEAAESEIELASKVQDLYSQLEHHKQLAAISDLTTGISHELGQPITNIRYTVQFYKRLLQNDLTYENVMSVFDSILEETQRMGGLIRRLSPLTSSRSVVSEFDLMDRIRLRVDGERPRLTESGIEVSISPGRPVSIFGDSVKFDQLMSNLLLNAIDAIDDKGGSGGKIDINVDESGPEVRMLFSDTGRGIPLSNTNKIFDPFFSTKPPGKGEGLGLFIIWNLLKMVGGRISVDTTYRHGARFIVTMPKNWMVAREGTK